ncbi:MAG: AgmX/PglI C-terminal domain-containing protein [Woeseiaceae bacterium]|nr:AgmX/PglI C-terminal domain-containing protein [Woeseiaceae bacterium]
MSAEDSVEEQKLQEQVERSERQLDDLELELRDIDNELEFLAQQNHRFEVLEQACRSLEELDDLGATHLFWGKGNDAVDSVEHIRSARQRIEEFAAEIERVEDMRLGIVDKIGDQNDVLDCLHYDLRDAMERAESRRYEWLIEREEDELPARVQVMPWARGCEEDQRFRKSMGMSLAASVALMLLVGAIAIPIAEREPMDELPERVAKLVRQERLPPPVIAEPEPIPEEQVPEPEPELVEEQPEDLPPTAEQPQLASEEQPDSKEKVKSKGILAFRDSFASRANLRPTAQLGSQARMRTAGEDAIGRPQRLMVTTSAPGSSGGINLSSISRDVGGGGGGIEGVQLARVASSIGGGDGPNRPLAAGAAAGRTDEEIQIVFDRYKAALYRLYNRELRKDPTLRGQLVLQLTIEPDGTVSFCQLHSSDMDAPLLAEQVVSRVSTFDFGAKEDIVAVTIIYPIDFLPAA